MNSYLLIVCIIVSLSFQSSKIVVLKSKRIDSETPITDEIDEISCFRGFSSAFFQQKGRILYSYVLHKKEPFNKLKIKIDREIER